MFLLEYVKKGISFIRASETFAESKTKLVKEQFSNPEIVGIITQLPDGKKIFLSKKYTIRTGG